MPTNKPQSLSSQLHTLKTLSDIGREITSTLDMEKILFTIYKKVNKLMDATIFGIGLYQADTKLIEYQFAIAENKKYKPYTRDTKDKNQFPVWCIENKKPVFINDVNKEYKRYLKKNKILEPSLEDGTKEKVVHSLLYLPIIVKRKIVGIISVQSYKKNAYSTYHLEILQNIASYAGMAIENARHFHSVEEKVEKRTKDIIRQQKEIEKSHTNTRLLSNIGREIAASLSVKEILEKTYKNVNKLMDANSFGIAIFNKEKKHLDFIYYIESGKPLPFHFVDIVKDNRPATWCFNNQKAVFMNDFLKDYVKYNLNKPTALKGEFTHSIIYLPLTSKNKQIGVITIQSLNRNAYTEYHLDILKNLAVYVVNALDNARLYQDMEAEVEVRTVEISKQKEKIEKTYTDTKLLSEIGREITTSLSVDEITEKVYKSVNTLMDASVFGIGLFNKKEKRLDFPGVIEKGKKLQSYELLLEDSNSFSIWCFNNQKEMVINDYWEGRNTYFPKIKNPAAIRGTHAKSLIYIPLSTPTKKLGVFTVQSFKKDAYSEYHLNILRNLAIYIAIALDNSRLYENLKKRTQEIEKSYQNIKLLSDIGREITASLSLEELINKAYKNVNSLMDASVFGIALLNVKENILDFPVVIEKGKKISFSYSLTDTTGVFSVQCYKTQKAIMVNNLKKDYNIYFPGKKMPQPKSKGKHAESLIYLPLTTGKKKLGVITIQSFKQNAYTEYHLDILRNLAIYIVIALENARLYSNMEDEVKLRTAEIENQKEELQKLSIVASETNNAILIAGPKGEIEWINEGFTRLTGYTLKKLKEKGNTIMEVSENPKISEYIKGAIKNRQHVSYEVLSKTLDGREIWLQTMLTPIIGKDGKIRNLVAIDSDITKLKYIETEMRDQNKIISEKNKHITDSINYAKRIQDALLPSDEVIGDVLPNSFVLSKPKDIVSGDFYWITEKDNKVFFAVVDCTGHGVPGAFVSIIGHNGLYRSINEFGLTKPSEILDKLNELVEETFRQNNGTQINDGMDIALCCYDPKSQLLEFAGANNPLYHIRDGKLTEIKGDKQPVGAFDHRKNFMNHEIQLKENDRLYIFSDGYADQFGGISGKKFKYNKLTEMLLSFHSTPMHQQRAILNETIVDWMKGHEQLDDICVIGMKV